MADTPAKPRRRWFAFSLRTLFVVVTMAAILTAFAVAYPEGTAVVLIAIALRFGVGIAQSPFY